jgi:hypothetical protein
VRDLTLTVEAFASLERLPPLSATLRERRRIREVPEDFASRSGPSICPRGGVARLRVD